MILYHSLRMIGEPGLSRPNLDFLEILAPAISDASRLPFENKRAESKKQRGRTPCRSGMHKHSKHNLRSKHGQT